MIFGSFMSVSQISSQSREYSKLQSLAENEKNLESVKVIKKPNKLIFVHEGNERNFPKYLIVLPNYVDYPIEDLTTKSFIEPNLTLDWSFIVGYLFSLLVFILTYDLVSGEKERGTLRLLASNAIPKDKILIGEFLGIFLTLLPLLLIGFIISLIVILLNTNISLDGSDWTKIFLFIFLSFFFISSMVSIGILISSLSTKSSSSLIVSLLIWTFIGIILPNGSSILSELIYPIPSFYQFEKELKGIEQIFDSKGTVSSMMLREIYERKDLSEVEKREEILRLQRKIHNEHRKALEEYKEALFKARDNYLKKLENQRRIAKIISKFSPISLFMDSAEKIIITGYTHQQIFFKNAVQYMMEYTKFANRMREELKDKAKIFGPTVVDKEYKIQGISWISFKDVEFDRELLPKFPDYKFSISEGMRMAFADIIVLVFFSFLFFLLSYSIFLRYDVR
jgi:ABC-type transport system involved in multi-copper enzyme maturation permease subunit